MTVSIAKGLVERYGELNPHEISGDALQSAKLHILDSIGVAIMARRMNEPAPALAWMEKFAGHGAASVIGSCNKFDLSSAAFVNGCLIHALDFDDTHPASLAHISAVMLPVALAVGEEREANGLELLAGFIAGAESQIRISQCVPHAFHAKGFHATTVAGVFGAAMTASNIYRLSKEESLNALGIAGSSASGLLEFLQSGTNTKIYHPGMAAKAGILAAQLASCGAEGPDTVLEGKYGLYASFLGMEVNPEDVLGNLDNSFETNNIQIKRYPACHLSHMSFDALYAAFGEDAIAMGVDVEEIDRIKVLIPRQSMDVIALPREDKLAPRSTYEAKFSLPFSIAALLCHRGLTPRSFSDEAICDQEILSLTRRIEIEGRDVDAPPADAEVRIEIKFKSGEKVVDVSPAPEGQLEISGKTKEVRRKFFANCGGEGKLADELFQRILGLDEEPNISYLAELSTRIVQQTTGNKK